MNPAMNVNGQREMHPDAETLSAFTEQALDAKERDEVLKHLAVCGRCRQVVALAREAAGAEVAAARHEVVRPGAWWRSWGLVLGPAAALAATAVIAFYIHDRAVERTAEVAKLEQQQTSETNASPPQATPQPRLDAVQPTPTSSVDAPIKLRETDRPSHARKNLPAKRDEIAAVPPPEPANRPASEHEEYRGSPSAEIHGAMAYAHAPTQASTDDKTPSEAANDDEERKKQAEETTEERHLYAAKAATPTGLRDTEIYNAASAPAGSPAAASSQQVEVDAQRLETQPAPEVTAGSLNSLRLSGFSDALMARPTHLPSGLPALSIATSDHRVLAIDEKGALFFSDDSGLTWEKVRRQWNGRAILVRRKTAEDPTHPAATAPQAAGSTSVSDESSRPETVFELVNDQNELWLSADGRIWNPK
jgi:Putative zinc-finger